MPKTWRITARAITALLARLGFTAVRPSEVTPPLDYEEIIDAFRRGTLEIDCRAMVLSQRGAPGEIYRGQGYIRQAEGGALEFKLYVETTENVKPYESLNLRMRGEVGTMHPEGLFYDLVATARDGTVWSADRVMPGFSWDMTQHVLARGQMLTMKSRSENRQDYSPFVQLHFFEDFTVPLYAGSEKERFGQRYIETDKAEFEEAGAKWIVRKRDDRMVIEAETLAGPFPDEFALRIQEAIQFVTGQPVFWRARLAGLHPYVEFELMSPWRGPRKTQMDSPISRATEGYFQYGWPLFGKYLTYVSANTPAAQWSPISYHLYNAAEASGNSVDASAVGYCVCLEALASFVPMPADKTQSERVAAYQTKVRDWLAEDKDAPELAVRLTGMVAGLSQERPTDKLYALARTGHVTEAYIKAWTRLRNKHVHPRPADLRKPDASYYQEMLQLIHQVETLIFEVVFYLIGYVGPYTDYGKKGYPKGQYPQPEGGGATTASVSE